MSTRRSPTSAIHWLLAIALLLGGTAPALGDELFDGKTISYVVATKPGGGYDAYARLIAPYLETYLPGATVVVKNVPGAGHLIGTNQVYAADADGTTIVTFNTGLVYAQLRELDGVEFDLARMSWIGKASADPRVLLVGSDSAFQSFDDVLDSDTPIVLASPGRGSAGHNELLLLRNTLGFQANVVPGYGGSEAEMAVLRGEVDGLWGSASSLLPFVERGQGRLLLSIGADVGELDGPLRAESLSLDEDGERIVALIASQSSLGRLTAAPPGVPSDLLGALRSAYAAALADPALQAQAERLGLPLAPLDGEAVAARIDAALAQSPRTLELIRNIVNER